jgi:glutamate-1-semialdehyde 2,1-aminomutase
MRGVMKNFSKSQALQKRAQAIVPLGVNSNFRYWGEDVTPYMSKAKGGYLWDADGNKYIDYRLAFGPIILGHAYDKVNAKVREEIEYGTMAAMTYELEIEVAEKIVKMCPAVEMVRFACSGTEATMHAIRVARAYTGREIILKFEGNYHGFHDYTLWSTYAPAEAYGNRRSPIPVPASSGIPKVLGEKLITLPFNDVEGFERMMKSYGHLIATVITEPCQGNCGAILPEPGFLDLIRQRTEEYGVVFILDEVKTGFRIANGGAQEYYNLKPDLATYAKALGNGFPLAAFGGKKEIMSIIGHGVAQGGTYNNNKPGVAAAWATLTVLENEPVMQTLNARGGRLMAGIDQILTEAGLVHCMNGYPAMFTYAIGKDKITCQRDWNDTEKDFYLEIIDALIERGVMPDHDAREPWFLCYDHSDKDIDDTLTAFREAVKACKK